MFYFFFLKKKKIQLCKWHWKLSAEP